MASGQVDDAQPPSPERGAAVLVYVDALIIGPAMLHELAHRGHGAAVRIVGIPADAAHRCQHESRQVRGTTATAGVGMQTGSRGVHYVDFESLLGALPG